MLTGLHLQPTTRPATPDLLQSALSLASLPAVAIAADFAIINAAGVVASLLYPALVGLPDGDWCRGLGIGLAASVLFVGILQIALCYRTSELLQLRSALAHATPAWLFALGTFALVGFLLRIDPDMSRGVVVTFAALGLCGIVAHRLAVRVLLIGLIRRGALAGTRIAVLTDGERADVAEVLRSLERHGYVIASRHALPEIGGGSEEGVLRSLIAQVRGSTVAEVVMVIRWSRFLALEPHLVGLQAIAVPIKLVAEEPMAKVLTFGSCDFGPIKGVVLKPAALSPGQRALKRSFDVAVSGAALLMLSPVLALTAMAIKLDSRGPVLFKQRRGGFNGRHFRIWKFRSMTVLEDGTDVRQARAHDLRITRVGRILRALSIDELPQLMNVLLGHMSLVGPRPHALAHDDTYSRLIAPYPARHGVLPGITGWAQVNGCRGETAEVGQMRRRVEYDLAYIRNWSLWLDLGIIGRTILEVARCRAY